MAKKQKLRPDMSVGDFDCGYWYALELRDFAKSLGIARTSRLRKDELEAAIRTFLRDGRIMSPAKRPLSQTGTRDSERGLRLGQEVKVYTNNPATKDFIESEALRLDPGYKMKSGARLRLNRWREEKLTAGIRITYGDLVKEYVRLSRHQGPFKQLPSGRYINFLSDFHRNEKNATRQEARAAWHALKKLDIPKNYQAWRRWRNSQRK